MKRALCLLAVWCAASAAGGCSGDAPSPPTAVAARPFAGRTIEIRTVQLGAAERWPLILTEFENEWGARTTFAEYARLPELHTWGPRLFGSPPLDVPDPSALLILPLEQLPEANLVPIPRDERDGPAHDGSGGLAWSDLFSGLRNNVCSPGGDPTVIPLSAPVLVCYFRRDLLEAANLRPPESWQEYQKLLDTLGDWAPGLTAVEPWGPTYRATTFLARAVGSARPAGQYSLFFDIETGEPLIDTPGFVRGLEQSLAALARMPAEVRTYSPADCRRELLAGRAALGIAFETPGEGGEFPIGPGWGLANASGAEDSSTEAGTVVAARPGRAESVALGLVPLPGATEVYSRARQSWLPPRDGAVNRVPLTGFAGMCAAVANQGDTDAQRPAWKLLARLAVQEFGAAFPEEVTTLCRTSQTDEPSRWAGRDLTADEAAAHVAAVAESLRSPLLVAEIPVIGRERFREALTQALDGALAGTTSPAEALSAVAKDWRRILDEIG
ncbi:MAG TPA: hypothetical protein VML55_03855, partial [Planctomycetaceae bacterium]|nr:hypothetical protein [Planctomycetaceae bacterium]